MAARKNHPTMIQHILVSLVILLIAPSFGAVLGIDFGADRIKVAAVVPGRSFDIVLDEASKRSHPSLVVFDDDVRQYGTSASSLVQNHFYKFHTHTSPLHIIRSPNAHYDHFYNFPVF